MKGILAKLRDKTWRNESGQAYMMYILMFPMIAGCFGLAMDASMGLYFRTAIQNNLDSAVVAGATQTSVDGSGKQVINLSSARTTVRSIYKSSRDNLPGIKCEHGCLSGTATVHVLNDPATGRGTIVRATVKEKSPTIFLRVFGIPYQEYNLVSEARLGSAREG